MHNQSTQPNDDHKGLARVGSLIAAALLAGLVYLGRESIFLAVGDYLVVDDPLQPADVIHVIAGEDGRTDYAIRLYKQGYGKRLFFTGGWCKIHGYDHGEQARALALAQGVAPEAIATDSALVTSTYSETVRLQAFIEASAEPVGSVMVVSDPYHMRRVRWTFHWVLGKAIVVRMAPVPFEDSLYRRDWWRDRGSRQHVLSEYLKGTYYQLRYHWGFGPWAKWLAALDKE